MIMLSVRDNQTHSEEPINDQPNYDEEEEQQP